MENKKRNPYKVVGWTWWDNFDYENAPLTDDVIDAVAEEIREHGYSFGGDSHQNKDGCVPLLNTAQAVRCSMREWGGIMAIAYLGCCADLTYMGWYMDCCTNELVYPEEHIDESLFTHPHYFKTGIKSKRLDALLNEGSCLDVLATWDEVDNIAAGDFGDLCAFDGGSDWVRVRIKNVMRFENPGAFIGSDIFPKTDIAHLTGYVLKTAINSARKNVPIDDKEGVTCIEYELVKDEEDLIESIYDGQQD